MARLLLALLVFFAGAPPAAAGHIPADLQSLSRAYLESGAKANRNKLAAYLRKTSSARNKALARFAIGMGDHEAEKYEAAAQALQQASRGGVPELNDYAVYYAAHSLAKAEEHESAAARVTGFTQKFPKSRLADDAVRIQAESLIRAERLAEAETLLKNSKSRMSEPVRLYLLARIEHIKGRALQAVRAYRRVYYKYPLSKQADEAERRLNRLRRGLGKSYPKAPSKWRLERGETLLRARRFSKAANEFRWALPGLEGKDRELAAVHRGAANYGRRHTTRAYNWLSPLEVGDPELDAERIYYLGECARRLRRIKEFEKRAEELGRKYPQSEWYEEALFSLGNYYLLENDQPRYREYYERAARTFPKGKHSARAHWKVCWRAYLGRDPRARSLLEEHIRLYPRSPSVGSAMYWLARIEEKENSELAHLLYSELISHFPHYYYGYLARDGLAKMKIDEDPGLSPPDYITALPPARVLSDRQSTETVRLLERGGLLHELGLEDLAADELYTADYRQPDSHRVGLELARQYFERGRYHRGLRAMKRFAFGYLRFPLKSMPREFWERLFPLPFEKQLRARARPHKLDPYLVAGLIRQESEFNPGARSRAGARGLMQIMPATGKGLALRLGIRRFSTRQLYHADTSLRLGTFHFRTVYDQFDRRLEYTLAAYNAGEHRVEEWVTWDKFDEPAEFVESIPFTETRGYVQAVLRNTEVYRRLYGGSADSRRERAGLSSGSSD